MRLWASALCAVMLTGCRAEVPRAVDKMSFFVTSVQAGDGGSIGGLDAADNHCATLAAAVGSPKRQWRAIAGHPDRGGKYGGERASSWNSAHETRGCSLPTLKAIGGAGLYYCFALD